MFCCDLTGPEEFTEMRYQQKIGMDQAMKVVSEVMKEYREKFGHELCEIEEYKLEDAQVALVALGSMCGTVKHVVNKMRERERSRTVEDNDVSSFPWGADQEGSGSYSCDRSLRSQLLSGKSVRTTVERGDSGIDPYRCGCASLHRWPRR